MHAPDMKDYEITIIEFIKKEYKYIKNVAITNNYLEKKLTCIYNILACLLIYFECFFHHWTTIL